MTPAFFSLEGLDGSGKSTQAALLAESVRASGREVVCVREPGGTPLSDAIRSLLLAPGTAVSPAAELLLFSAARAQLVSEVVAPALAAGKVVVADRFGWSTAAYQGYGRGMDLKRIETLLDAACGDLRPSHSFLLDIPVASMAARMRSDGRNPDRMERESPDFFERVRRGYLEIAATHADRFTVLDGARDKAELRSLIRAKVLGLLGLAEP